MSFGNKLKNLRIKKNLTQEEFAKILNVSRPTIGRYESGERFPDQENLIRIADYFNVTLDYLLDRSNIHKNILYIKEDESVYSKSKNIFLENLENLIYSYHLNLEDLNDLNFLKNILNFGVTAALTIRNLELKNKK